jgi:hypothetical protein
MSEENPTLPAKIGSMALHALNIVKEKVITPATETDGEHETTASMTDTAKDSADEDIADGDPLHEEVYDNDLERLIDLAIKSCKEKGKPSNGIPELVFCIPCIHPDHHVTYTLDKG